MCARFLLDDEYTATSDETFAVRWASPEVILHWRFSSKSDVWAFGKSMTIFRQIVKRPYSYVFERFDVHVIIYPRGVHGVFCCQVQLASVRCKFHPSKFLYMRFSGILTWEIYGGGQHPYSSMTNADVADKVGDVTCLLHQLCMSFLRCTSSNIHTGNCSILIINTDEVALRGDVAHCMRGRKSSAL